MVNLKKELFDRLSDSKFAMPQMEANSFGSESGFEIESVMKEALANPLFYPGLSESVFPGDTVAILLQTGLPQVRQVLAALMAQVQHAGIESDAVVVVASRETAAKLGVSEIQIKASFNLENDQEAPIHELDLDSHRVRIQIHDKDNESTLAYLVANQAGDPVHVNRQLVDADVVLPIGYASAGELKQRADCLYPEFGSSAIVERYRKEEGSFLARAEEVELASATLGTFFTIQIVAGPGDNVQAIICGARKDAIEAARTQTNELWEFEWTESVDVVLGTIESTALEQGWDDFVKALISASRLSVLEAPIVIWSDIAQMPNRRIRKACLSQFEDGISSQLSEELQHFAAILKERPVYLRSNLKRNQVEELGIGFIESPDEINRIAEPRSSGLLVRDAHKCQVKAENRIAQ